MLPRRGIHAHSPRLSLVADGGCRGRSGPISDLIFILSWSECYAVRCTVLVVRTCVWACGCGHVRTRHVQPLV